MKLKTRWIAAVMALALSGGWADPAAVAAESPAAPVVPAEDAEPTAPASKPIPPHLAEEFRIKREEVFEFAKKPVVTREGDKVTIAFATKGLCDVTVAIEDRNGRILRHLASGVLGPKAPPPFQRNSKEQSLVWDSKNDKGEYVDDRENTVVRVSLGLRARFERQHLWTPHRTWDMIAAQPEGVYTFGGITWGYLYRLTHAGDYAETVYPFGSDRLDKVTGLRTRRFEQSGKTLPWKGGFMYSSLLNCGTSTRGRTGEIQVFHGKSATAMAIRDGTIVVAEHSISRLATDGTSGGLPLEGPNVSATDSFWPCGNVTMHPRSIAISPDKKTLYATGYGVFHGTSAASKNYWLRGVGKVDLAAGKPGDKMTVFAGTLKYDPKVGGSGPGQFKTPTSVDVDASGRVYVTDYYNHRLQVFDSDGKHLKDIPVRHPAEVKIDPRNGAIYVVTWGIDCSAFLDSGRHWFYTRGGLGVTPTLRHMGTFDDPKVVEEHTFSMGREPSAGIGPTAIINFWAPGESGPELWIHDQGLRILRKKQGANTLEEVRNIAAQGKKDVPDGGSSGAKLCVNEKTGDLYIGSLALEPETGKFRTVRIPGGYKEMCFDLDGHAYLCTGPIVSRFAVSADDQWREVPFDYGENRAGGISVLVAGGSPFHTGGISVTARGNVVVGVMGAAVREPNPERERLRQQAMQGWQAWTPLIYPGRAGEGLVRVWDKHGKMLFADAVPGVGYMHNLYMDRDDNIYVASGARRTGYTDINTGTLIKMRPKGRILSEGAVLPLKTPPERPPETELGAIGSSSWWEGAEWFYGGIGYNGKNSGGIHPCHCKQFRVAHDYFARTFVPESVHYTVAVLDSEGNVVMRIGQYGSVDEGVPLIADPRIPKPRSLGGDEVALFHPAYLAVHTDRRLYINDPGNDRLVSVKLDYHANESMPLKEVPDATAIRKP